MVLSLEEQKKYYIENNPAEKKAVEIEPWCPTDQIMAKYGIVISNFLLDFETKNSAKLVWAYYTPNNVKFILYIPPGVYRTFYKNDYDQQYEFFLPFPHRYLVLELHNSINLRSPSFHISQVLYTSCKLTDKLDIYPNILGSFLPNSHNDSPYFCLNFSVNIFGPSSSNILDCLTNILLKYSNSSYNSDYLENAYESVAFAYMEKNLKIVKSLFLDENDPYFKSYLVDFKFDNTYHYNSFSSKDFSDPRKLLASYRTFIKNLSNFETDFHAEAFHYTMVLKCLENTPNFWDDKKKLKNFSRKYSQYSYNLRDFSIYKDFCYNKNDMKIQVKDLFPYDLFEKVSK